MCMVLYTTPSGILLKTLDALSHLTSGCQYHSITLGDCSSVGEYHLIQK